MIVRQDGRPLSRAQATPDLVFRSVNGEEESYIQVQQARMYSILDDHAFGEHVLELICPAGLAAFAFTFTSCVDPDRVAPSMVTG